MISDKAPIRLIDGSTPKTAEELFTVLDELNIAHSTISHPPMYTVSQSKTLRSCPTHGGYTKNLFLRNNKDSMWLVTCHEDRRVNLHFLEAALQSGRLSFSSEDRLNKYLGVDPGAISPFSLINDVHTSVGFLIDEQLLQESIVHLHPLNNRQTTTIEIHDLLRFVRITRHIPFSMNFDESIITITNIPT